LKNLNRKSKRFLTNQPLFFLSDPPSFWKPHKTGHTCRGSIPRFFVPLPKTWGHMWLPLRPVRAFAAASVWEAIDRYGCIFMSSGILTDFPNNFLRCIR
jgi:hypothetical protein